MASLTNLTELSLSHNNLSFLPSAIRNLAGRVTLYLNGNQLHLNGQRLDKVVSYETSKVKEVSTAQSIPSCAVLTEEAKEDCSFSVKVEAAALATTLASALCYFLLKATEPAAAYFLQPG